MVMTDNLVGFQIPTLDHLVLGTGEEIWMTVRNGETTDGRDMTGQRQLQFSRCQIPDLGISTVSLYIPMQTYLNHTITCPGCEPLISRVDSDSSDPTHMSRNDSCQFPCYRQLGTA